MSAEALQRVVVRMLFDARLVDQVYADPVAALPEVDLTDAERAWLRAPDVRRWRADPLRRTRALEALLHEYPVATALVIREAGGVPALDAFFSDPTFHRCIQARGVLALSFGRWLCSGFTADVAAAARIEWAIAEVRRAPPRPAPSALTPAATLHTAPWIVGCSVSVRGHARYLACQAALGSGGSAAVLDTERALPAGAPAPGQIPVLVEQTETGATVEHAPDALVALVRWCQPARPLTDALTWLSGHGLDAAEAQELLQGLVADGVLLARTSPES